MQRLPPRTVVRVFELPGWAMALIGLAVGAVLLAVGLALFVVLAPIGIGLYFYVRWKMRKVMRDLQARQEAMQAGVQLLRVHDVSQTVQALHVWRGLADAALTDFSQLAGD